MATRTGRRSIFRGKAVRVQGWLTKVGKRDFEYARGQLALVVGWKANEVSDADTVEFLARGEAETRKYLKKNPAG